jgi:hypothetical protein
MAIFKFNFRATTGFVTDGANSTYVIISPLDTYPQTRNGITFGYTATVGLDSRDRASGNIPELAGIHFVANGGTGPSTFRVDLPNTGGWDVRLGCGDASGVQTIKLEVRDNATAFITISDVTTSGANTFLDATGVERTNANWSANNVAVNRNFVSTILNLLIQEPTTNASCVAHLSVESTAPPVPIVDVSSLLPGLGF